MCLKGIGDLTLAYQCFKLTLAFNNDHAEAYNNLAVLELRKGHIEQVRTEIAFLAGKYRIKNILFYILFYFYCDATYSIM